MLPAISNSITYCLIYTSDLGLGSDGIDAMDLPPLLRPVHEPRNLRTVFRQPNANTVPPFNVLYNHNVKFTVNLFTTLNL